MSVSISTASDMAIGRWAGVINSLYNVNCHTCPVKIKKDDLCFYDWGVIKCRFCSPEAAAEYEAERKNPTLPVIGSDRPWYEVEESINAYRRSLEVHRLP